MKPVHFSTGRYRLDRAPSTWDHNTTSYYCQLALKEHMEKLRGKP